MRTRRRCGALTGASSRTAGARLIIPRWRASTRSPSVATDVSRHGGRCVRPPTRLHARHYVEAPRWRRLMVDELTDQRRGCLADETFAELAALLPEPELGRVREMFHVWANRRRPDLAPAQRSLLGVYMPGIPSAPWYEPEAFLMVGPVGGLSTPYCGRSSKQAWADGLELQPYGWSPDGTPLPVGAVPPGWKSSSCAGAARPYRRSARAEVSDRSGADDGGAGPHQGAGPVLVPGARAEHAAARAHRSR